jgi:hypothetical protein
MTDSLMALRYSDAKVWKWLVKGLVVELVRCAGARKGFFIGRAKGWSAWMMA